MTLKPCPNCGSLDLVILTKPEGTAFDEAEIVCKACGCQLYMRTGSLKRLIEEWNYSCEIF